FSHVLSCSPCLAIYVLTLSRLSPYLFSFVHVSPAPAIHTLPLHDALPISPFKAARGPANLFNNQVGDMRSIFGDKNERISPTWRSEEHTSELQSRFDLVCRLLLEKKKKKKNKEDKQTTRKKEIYNHEESRE